MKVAVGWKSEKVACDCKAASLILISTGKCTTGATLNLRLKINMKLSPDKSSIDSHLSQFVVTITFLTL